MVMPEWEEQGGFAPSGMKPIDPCLRQSYGAGNGRAVHNTLQDRAPAIN